MKSTSSGKSVQSERQQRVQIILCTFNGKKYISEQLESIFSQSRLPDVISIYDDASEDETLKVVQESIDRVKPANVDVRVFKNERNLGYVGNFSQGIQSAEGDILFLCDQDDIWHPDKIKITLDLMEETGVDLAFSDGRLIDANGDATGYKSVLGFYGLSSIDILKFPSQAIVRLARRNYVNGAAMAVRREAAKAALPVPVGLPHDYWMAIWCALHGGIAVSPKYLYYYRQHSSNVIGVGLNRWYYTWYGVLRSPHIPRLREHARYVELVQRIRFLENAAIFVEKLVWLEACVAHEGRFSRLCAVVGSYFSGQYHRFGVRYSWTRDLIAIFALQKKN